MSEQEQVHATVLAALEEAERVDAAAAGPPWRTAIQTHGEWVGIQDNYAALGSAVRYDNAALIVASRDAWPASLALVRLVVTEHAPTQVTDLGGTWWICDYDSDWPCDHYRAAAAVVGVDLTPDPLTDTEREADRNAAVSRAGVVAGGEG